MKNYIKFLIKKNKNKFLFIGIIVLLISAIPNILEIQEFEDRFYCMMAEIEVEKEHPELISEMRDINKQLQSYYSNNYNEYNEYEVVSLSDKYKNLEVTLLELNRNIVNDFKANNKNLKESDIKLLKQSYLEKLDKNELNINMFYRHELPSYFKTVNSQDYFPKNELEFDKKIIENSENKIAYNNSIRAIFEKSQSLIILFILIMIGFLTSIENMTRLKLFDESLPISKKNKYISKALVIIMSIVLISLLFLVLNTSILKFSNLGNIIDFSSYHKIFIKDLLYNIGIGLLFLFSGSICGNIISYMGVSLFLFNGLFSIQFIFLSLLNLMFNKNIDTVFYGIENINTLTWLKPIVLIDTMNYSVIIILKYLIVTFIIFLLGYFVQNSLKIEYRGKFFLTDIAKKIFFILSIIYTSVITTLIVSSSNINNIKLLNIVLLIIFTIIFTKIYKLLFNLKIRL